MTIFDNLKPFKNDEKYFLCHVKILFRSSFILIDFYFDIQ